MQDCSSPALLATLRRIEGRYTTNQRASLILQHAAERIAVAIRVAGGKATTSEIGALQRFGRMAQPTRISVIRERQQTRKRLSV
jgi:hypothetical protein